VVAVADSREEDAEPRAGSFIASGRVGDHEYSVQSWVAVVVGGLRPGADRDESLVAREVADVVGDDGLRCLKPGAFEGAGREHS
jgi:hypothetical protein